MQHESKWGRLMKTARGGKFHATVPLKELYKCKHWYYDTVHRQNVEVKNAKSKKRRKTKRQMGQNVEWKKCRIGENVD
jgi:hypothetical protein